MAFLPAVYGQRSRLSSGDPQATGLMGWWPLQDSGSTAADASANGNLGVAVGSPLHSVSPFGRAFVLDGSTQYINCGSSTMLCPPSATVSCWINPSSLSPPYSSVVNRVSSIGTTFAQLFLKSSGKLAVYLTTSGSAVSYDGTGVYTLSTGAWYHVVWSYDVSVGLRSYVNAMLDATAAATGTLSSFAASLYIGEDSFTSLRRFPGQVADVRVYGRMLTYSEISTLYREQFRPFLTRPSARARSLSTLIYQTWSNPAERLSLLRADLPSPLERLTSVERVITLPLSHLASRIARTTSQPSEILGLQQSQILVPAERFVIMRADRLSSIESLQSAREDTTAPAERLTLVQETTSSPILPSLLAQSGWTSSSEWLSTAAVSVVLDQERLSLQTSTISSPGEREGSVLGGTAVPLERLSSLSGGWTLSLEHEAEAMSAWVSPAERLLGVATTWIIPLERQSTAFSVEQDWSSPAEWLTSVLGARTMASEHLLRVRETWSLPIQLSFVTAMWIEPGPGCWTVLARDVTVTVLLTDVTMSVETP